jgi:predicted nucleic acid-binding protein
MPKVEVCDRLSAFLTSRGIKARDEDVMLDALKRYRSHNKLHFVDACLAAYGVAANQPVHSFDSDFGRFDDLVWTK